VKLSHRLVIELPSNTRHQKTCKSVVVPFFECVSDIPFGIANKCDPEDGEVQPDETYFSFVYSQWPVLFFRCLLMMGGGMKKQL